MQLGTGFFCKNINTGFLGEISQSFTPILVNLSLPLLGNLSIPLLGNLSIPMLGDISDKELLKIT